MATSGATTGYLTAGQHIETAFMLLSETTPEDGLTGAEYDTGVRMLNFMLKSWQAKRVNLWRDLEISTTWPAATREGTLSPTIIDVLDIRWLDANSQERTLQRREAELYNPIPNKDLVGDPILFCFVKQIGNPRIRVWPVPAAAKTFKMNVARVSEDITSVDQEIDIPQEWTETVYYNLATRLVPILGKHRIDPACVADVNAKATSLYHLLSDPDRAGSVFLTPGDYS